MVEQWENYIIRSNRESGFGRYDIMLILRPQRKGSLPAVVLEFKVYNEKKEKNLEDTVKAALQQIEEKQYDAELIGLDFEKE